MVSPTAAVNYFRFFLICWNLTERKAAPTNSRNRTGTYLKPGWTWPHQAGTFSGTLLNLTWLCTKSLSGNFSTTFSGTFSTTFSGTVSAPEPSLRNAVELDLAAPDSPRPSPEPSLEPCWTWPGSAPKPPSPSPEPCWTWPGVCTKASRNLLRNLLRNPWLTRSLHQCTPELFWAEDPISLCYWGTNQKNKPTLVFLGVAIVFVGVVFFWGGVCFLFLLLFKILYNCFPFSSEWKSLDVINVWMHIIAGIVWWNAIVLRIRTQNHVCMCNHSYMYAYIGIHWRTSAYIGIRRYIDICIRTYRHTI